MDPVTSVLAVSIVGGLVIAAGVFWLQRPSSRPGAAAASDPGISTDMINAAHIRVAGIGGLGLVAMAATVAWNVPAIRLAVGTGLILGLALAAALIVRRRAAGTPSTGQRGANAVLPIDAPAPPADEMTNSYEELHHVDRITRRLARTA
jgi:hypothetical protein